MSLSCVRLTDFRCVRDLTLALSPLHALIGPNDAGKSTVLQALEQLAATEVWQPGGADAPPSVVWIERDGARLVPATGALPGDPALVRPFPRGVRAVRLTAVAMRQPSALIPTGDAIAFGPTGEGLAASIDALQARHLDAWLAIRERFRERFPTAREVGTANTADQQKVLQIILHDETIVHADQMSAGMLYWLAFEVLRAADRPSLLLIEAPELGLHPHRIREVVALLRELSADCQIVLATHSPLVINELQPHEVSVITRTPDHGTRATRLDHTRDFAERSKTHSPGELWLAYANGADEQNVLP